MRGRWAAGIEPRNFAWILKDQLAVSERPGGFAPHHRRVRRQEEILWLNVHGFTRVVSLLPSNHNLHAYDELHIPSAHFALPSHGDARPVLGDLYGALWTWLHDGERVLLHQDELGEQVAGVVAGFLCWSRLLPEPPRAVSAVEQLLRRQMGHAGRSIVAAAAEMPLDRLSPQRAPAGAEGPGAAAAHPASDARRASAAAHPSAPPLLREVPPAEAPVPAGPVPEAGAPPAAPAPAPMQAADPVKRSGPRSASPKPSSGAVREPKKTTPAKQGAKPSPDKVAKADAAKAAAAKTPPARATGAKAAPAKTPPGKAGSKKSPAKATPKVPAEKARGKPAAKKAAARPTDGAPSPLGGATGDGGQQ